jgi:hypothetical protein
MEDNPNRIENGRQPQQNWKWKTTSIFLGKQIGRRPQKKNGRLPKKKIKIEYNQIFFFEKIVWPPKTKELTTTSQKRPKKCNERRPQKNEKMEDDYKYN